MSKKSCLGLCLWLLTVTVTHAGPPTVERGLLPGDAFVAPATSTQREHSVAKGGDGYLVAWSDTRGEAAGGGADQSGGDVFGIRLDADGNPIEAAPFLIAGGMGLQDRPLVAWNGSAWLVVYLSQDPVGGYYENRMRAVRVSAEGEVLEATPIIFPPSQYSPDTVGLQVAGQNGQWLVTRCIYHADAYGTYLAGQRIDGNGVLLDTTPIQLQDWVYGGTRIVVADGEYLVVGPDWTNSSTIKARRIGLDAQPIGVPFTVPDLNIAGNGAEYYVAWIAGFVNLVGSRMTLDGTLLTPAGTVLVANFAQYTQSTLTHDGTNWWFEWGVSDQLHTVRINGSGTVLDPNGGVLLPIVIGGNVNTAYGPVLVPRTGGGVHVMWYDLRVAMGYDTNVFSLPVSAGNVPGTERCVSTGTPNQRTPDLAAGPDGEIAVVFVSEAAHDDRILVHRLDAGGQPITTEPIEVARGPAFGKAGIAWNGSIYLVTWDDGSQSQVRARRMNGDGSFVDPAPFDIMPGFGPDVEALGDDFLIASARVSGNPQFIDAWMRIVDGPTGGFVNGATLIGGGYVSVGPRVHSDGTRWVITYQSNWTHDDSRSDAIYNFVSPGGAFTPAANPATTSGGSGTPDVAFSGSKYLFVWRNNTLANANNYIAGRIMNADGSFATGNFTIAEAPGRQLRPVVAWDGTDFVVAWDDQRNQGSFFDERTDIYGTRVSEAGAVLDPGGFPIYVGPQGDATAALLARADGVSFVASARFETTSLFDSYRIGVTVLGSAAGTGAPWPVALDAAGMQQNAPNPFVRDTRIDFALSRPEPVRLAVYDVTGRLVRTLVQDAALAAGRHATVWDGRDATGARVAAGVYLYVLRTPSMMESRRLVLLK